MSEAMAFAVAMPSVILNAGLPKVSSANSVPLAASSALFGCVPL
jgi:hypothetical protein